jgi:hypothetical protein
MVGAADNFNPVNVFTAVYDKCKNLSGCAFAFAFTLHDQWNRNSPTDINCDYALIRGVADTVHNPAFTVGSLRQRLCGLQTYMGGSPPLACTNENPDHQCHP